jgi:hypothetical protein
MAVTGNLNYSSMGLDLESYSDVESRAEQSPGMVYLHLYFQYTWNPAHYLHIDVQEKTGERLAGT